MSDKVEKQEAAAPEILKVRITLTSPSMKHIERVGEDILTRSRKNDLTPRGPVRMPTKVLKVTTRKTPNGEGSKTWDCYEMRIHKRVIDIEAPTSVITRVAGTSMDPKVNITITIAEKSS